MIRVRMGALIAPFAFLGLSSAGALSGRPEAG